MSTNAAASQTNQNKNNDASDNENVNDIDVDMTIPENADTNTNASSGAHISTNANSQTSKTRQQDSNKNDNAKNNNNTNTNDNNDSSNSNIKLHLSNCITCQRLIYTLTPSNTDTNKEKIDTHNTQDIDSAPFARQCMHRECPIRKTCNNNNSNDNSNNESECEECSQVSCCRGCNIILCEKCRNSLKVLQCGYHINKNNKKTNSNNDNNKTKESERSQANENNSNSIQKSEEKDSNSNSNPIESDYSCNEFICSHSCYKKIIFKYTILLKSNGFDSREHISLIKLKKMFMKPYLSGLYDSLMLPQPEIYQLLANEFDRNNNDKNDKNDKNDSNTNDDTIVNVNDINWNTVNKNNWFPFHECQGCKKYNCGCTEWVCCVNCRKYYCEQCERKRLNKCKLDECGNYTCCEWNKWQRGCHYCNTCGSCQLLFCTKGHCDAHYIV